MLAVLLIFGCISTPSAPAPTTPTTTPPVQNCSTVVSQVPIITQQCNNVSITTPNCGERNLPYTATTVPKLDLCTGDGSCVGQPLQNCTVCSSAMTRCDLVITNNDLKESGTWIVGANFTLGNSGTITQNPVTENIGPNETYDFDFRLLYQLHNPVTTATCAVYVISPAQVNDCQQITSTQIQCQNVTGYQNVSQQVCQ